MLLLSHGLIVVIHSMLAWITHYHTVYSSYRKLQPCSSLENENKITYRPFWHHSTGSQFLFKLILRFYCLFLKLLMGWFSQYLTELLQIHAPVRALRSANLLLLVSPKTRLKTKGDRAFAAAAPQLWSSLPLHIRSSAL